MGDRRRDAFDLDSGVGEGSCVADFRVIDHRGTAARSKRDSFPLAGGAVTRRGEEDRFFSGAFGFERAVYVDFAAFESETGSKRQGLTARHSEGALHRIAVVGPGR